MFAYQGTDIYMPVGDYGVPLPLSVKACCKACAQDLLDTDQVRFAVTRGGGELVRRDWTLSDLEATDGEFEVVLTEEESAGLPVGVYAWRLCLLRGGELRGALSGGIFTVGVSPRWP